VQSIIEAEGCTEYRTTDVPTGLEPYGVNISCNVGALLGAGGFGTSAGRQGTVLRPDEEVQLARRLQDADLLACHARHEHKIVAGAGYGGYEAPGVRDGSWDIYWVRGPRTAARLGLPRAFGLGNPATLLPFIDTLAGPRSAGVIGFMPHFERLAHGQWALVAAAAGIILLDPRADPMEIAAARVGCGTLRSAGAARRDRRGCIARAMGRAAAGRRDPSHDVA